jgi:valyl-tRNA synthetase
MHVAAPTGPWDAEALSLPDRWILSRLRAVTRAVTEALEGYRFNDAAATLYNFIWHEFCDWYLEAIKPILYETEAGHKDNTLAVLRRVLRDTLVLLHPVVPFVTEEIWHKLPGTDGSIMRARYPLDDPEFEAVAADPEAERRMKILMDTITGIRNIRGEMDLAPSLSLDVRIQSPDAEIRRVLDDHRALIADLARVGDLQLEAPGPKPTAAATAIIENATIFVRLEGVIDFEKETERLAKRIRKVEAEIQPLSKKLNNEDFLGKAPQEVVEKVREKHGRLLEQLHKLESTQQKIRAMRA